MTIDDQRAYNVLLRNNFPAFLHRVVLTLNPGTAFKNNWHIDAIEYELNQVRRGRSNRLIINMPPRHLKSITVSVAFTAFLLGHDPKRRIIGISYGEQLSAKHSADFRSIVQSPWYQRAFPAMRIARATDSEIHTTQRGFRKATSINAALTGFGGDLFCH